MSPRGRIVAVCVGTAQELTFGDRTETTAIDKRPVDGRVEVGPEGLAGDVQVDRRFHGGADRAVYAYAQEDAAFWSDALARPTPPGMFGENLRVSGLDLSGARIGERFTTSTGLELEVSAPRMPCRTLAGFLDVPDMIERFLSAGRPGAYLRVLTPGRVSAGDRLRPSVRHLAPDAPRLVDVMAWRRRSDSADRAALRRLADDPAAAADLRAWAAELSGPSDARPS
jgi:MOSC domain-containing protein YiiM